MSVNIFFKKCTRQITYLTINLLKSVNIFFKKCTRQGRNEKCTIREGGEEKK